MREFIIIYFSDPNPTDIADWPDVVWEPHSMENLEFLELRAGDNFTLNNGMRSRQCAFWRDYIPKVEAGRTPPITGKLDIRLKNVVCARYKCIDISIFVL